MSNEEKIQILKDKRQIIDTISPSFCAAKWLQTTLYLQNGYNHSCHHPAPHKIPVNEVLANPAALHNSSFKKEQRKLMLAGKRPAECDYCWKVEDLGKDYFSDRHYKTADHWAWNDVDKIAKSDPNLDINPTYLEVSFSNACNLKCSYCSSEVSSKWLEEIKQFGPYPTTQGNHDLGWLKQIGRYPYKNNEHNPYVDAFWKWFPAAIDTLKVFRITGGEPLMSKDLWKVFTYIKENPKPGLEIAINSNLCVDDKLIDRFIAEINNIKGCVKKIDVYTSLESTGIQAEYSRFGLDYELWSRNVRKVLEQTEVNVAVMTTINILSLPTMVDFIDVIMEFRKEFNKAFEYNRVPLSINFLRWPTYLSATLLPRDIREQYVAEILNKSESCLKYHTTERFARIYLEEWDQIKRFCDFLLQDENTTVAKQDFVKYINEYDKRRKTDFSATFPEYAKFLEEWNA